jgi:aminopeptidase N
VDSPALDFSTWGDYRKTVYIHGAFFLDALRKEMGDSEFFRLLEANLSLNRFKWTTTERFLELAQEMTEADLSPLIDRWFE